ncbi:MAG: hypothetical protein ACI4PP_01210 [Clostridia bacterium]
MNIGKIDLKNEFSAVKKKIKKAVPSRGTAPKKGKRKPTGEGVFSPSSRGTGPRRSVVFHVPVGIQTVIAVLVCCGVLFTAGFAVFTVEQMEINNLKKDLKAYSDDGVVPAGSMDDSVALNIESVAGRIDSLQKIIDGAADGTLSNDELQWIGIEVDEVSTESQILNDVLNDVDAGKAEKTAYKDTVQSPLVTLQQSYDALQVRDDDVADTTVEGGAATDTGAFKSSGGLDTGTKWGIAIAILAVLALAAAIFLFRHKIAALFSRSAKASARSGKRKNDGRGVKKPAPAGKKPAAERERPKKKPAEKPGEKEAPTEKTVSAATEKTAPNPGENEGEEKAVIDENEAFLEELAPALRKMAEKERQKAEDGSGMIEPAEEDLLTFDESVVTQDAIEEEEDSFFTKQGEDPSKGKEDR